MEPVRGVIHLLVMSRGVVSLWPKASMELHAGEALELVEYLGVQRLPGGVGLLQVAQVIAGSCPL